MFRSCQIALLIGVSVSAFAVVPAEAQSEAALRSSLEGRSVRLKIDMPGAADGVDVLAGRAFDYKQYGDRLKKDGTAIRAGETARVTLVKLKKDVIEFQLDGGGYGTFGDDTSTSPNIPTIDKTNREKDLEKAVKAEADAAKKRSLQRELDDVRTARERENRRIEAERTLAQEAKTREIARRRLDGGSRFNIRYSPAVPASVTSEHVMTALAEFVDFSGGVSDSPSQPSAPPISGLRKGLTRAEAQRLLGPPVESTERREGSLVVRTLVFNRGDERVTAEFVEDVLIRYTIVVK